MMDKRRYQRDVLSLGIQMKLQNNDIQCNIQNMSDGGALARIDTPYNKFVSEEIIGQEVSFSIGFDTLSTKKYKGRIIRLMEEEDAKYIAIFFM
jgi:hypothetical protein